MKKIVVVISSDCSDCSEPSIVCLNYNSIKDFLYDLNKDAKIYISKKYDSRNINNNICHYTFIGGIKFNLLDFVSFNDYYPPEVYALNDWFDKNFEENQK